MQRKWRRTWRRTAAAVLVAATTGHSYAMPQGGQISSGTGSISQTGPTMTVSQTTDKLAVNWQSFGIGANERVSFVQPAATAVALNRVLGNDASAIYGQLTANGRVFLINPNGILFAPGAQINVGGLVASTLRISDKDFLAGKYNFNQGTSAGKVINQGNITVADGGYAALLAPEVRNEGVVIAKQGTVALGAGSRATIDFDGDGKLNLAVNEKAVNALAANKGLIQADGGLVVMSAQAAGDLVNTVINNEGVIKAQSAHSENGVIVLDGGPAGAVLNSGTLDASGKGGGETGGTVKVLGDKVALMSGAAVDVSGDAGGGTALIGGNFRGAGTEQNATATYVDKNTYIRADAITKGDGGQVAVWSDEATRFYGAISARGGSQSGDGGRGETSGKYLDAGGKVDASAANGTAGEWLLDPGNITIQATGPDTNTGSSPNFASTADNAVLTTGSITTALNGGTSVTVTTGDGGSQGGDIIVNDSIAMNAADSGSSPTLTLNAQRDVTLNAAVSSSSGQLNLVFNADSNRDGAGAVIVKSDISTNGGSIKFGGDNTYTVGTCFGGTGDRSVTTLGGNLTFYGDVMLGTGTDVTLNTATADGSAGGNITFDSGASGNYGKVDSGNSYTFVAGSYTWEQARNSAATGDVNTIPATGSGGAVNESYLVTITSSMEQSMANSAANGQYAWIGARANTTDLSVSNRTWRWVTGPEGLEDNNNGRAFYTDNNHSGGGTAINGQYTNWAGGEPNNSTNEDCGLLGLGSIAAWNDYAVSATINYVKETNLNPTTLNINAGATGNVTFGGAVGSNKVLGGLNVQRAQDVTFGSTVKVAGDIRVGGSGAVRDVNIKNAVTTTNGGAVAINNTGLLKIAAASDLNLDGAFSQNGARKVWTAGDIITTGDAITFNSPVVLTGDVALTSAGGDITFVNTIKAAPSAGGDPAALTITAGSGTVTFNGTVGGYDYEATAVGMNPLAYWSFDETGGTGAADSSGHNITATVGSNVTEGVTSAPGLGTCFKFSGSGSSTSDYVYADNTGLSVAGSSFTHLVWINPSLSDDGYHSVMGYQQAGATDRYPSLYVYNGNSTTGRADLHGGFGDGSWNAYITTNGIIKQNTWNLVVQRFDKTTGNLDISVNGSAFYNVANFSGHTPNGNTKLNIGYIDNFFAGLIDEPAMFNTTLTNAQVSALYTAATNLQAPLQKVTVASAGNVVVNKAIYANNISLTAGNIALADVTGALQAAGGDVIIRPMTADRPINLGTETAGSLSLTAGEISRITAGTLRIGDTTAGIAGALSGTGIASGAITISDAVDFTNVTNTHLITPQAITESGGAVTAANLAVTTGGAVALNDINAITNLAVASGNNAVSINNGATNLNIGPVDGVSGLNSGTANITLTDSGTVAQTAAITANGLELLGAGGTYNLNLAAGNDITTLAGATGTVDFSNNHSFTIGTVNTAGLTTTGNVTLAALNAGDLVVTGAITKTGAGDSNLILKAGDNIIIDGGNGHSGKIAASGGKLNIGMDADVDGNDVGGIDIFGTSISANGGDILLGGGAITVDSNGKPTGIDYAHHYTKNGYSKADSLTTYTKIDPLNTGDDGAISVKNSTVDAGGGSITMRGKNILTSMTFPIGIDLIDSGLKTSGSGSISLDGIGGDNNNPFGINIIGSNSYITTQNGSINLTGATTAAANIDYGIKWSDLAALNIYSTGGCAVNLNATDGAKIIGYAPAYIGCYYNGSGISSVYDSPITITAGAVDLSPATVKTNKTVNITTTGGTAALGTIGAGTTLTIDGAGAVTQASGTTLTAAGLELLGTNGTYTLTNTGNTINTLAAAAGSVAFSNSGSFAVGTVTNATTGHTTAGLTATGEVTLQASGPAATLTIDKPVSKTTGGTAALTLTAGNSVLVNGALTNASSTGGWNISLTGGSYIKDSALLSTSGTVSLTAPIIDLNTAAITAGGGFTADGAAYIVSDSLSITTTNAPIVFTGSLDTGNDYVLSSAVFDSASGKDTATWLNAYDYAQTYSPGRSHLVTIGSAAEETRVQLLAGGEERWIGHSDDRISSDGTWVFDAGNNDPHNGQQFWTGGGSNSGGHIVNGGYANWNGGYEPNGGTSENYAEMLANGTWNDLNGTQIYKYVIEVEKSPAALTLNAGTGAVTFGGTVGGVKNLGGLTINANQVNVGGPVLTAGTQTYNAAVKSAADSIIFNSTGGGTAGSPGNTSTVSGAVSNNLVFNGSLATTAATGTSFTFQPGGAGTTTLSSTVTTGGGNLVFAGGGAVLTGSGNVISTGGTTANGNVDFAGPVTINNAAGQLFTTGGGRVTFAGTLNEGAAATPLTINAGGGTVTFNSDIGASSPLASLTLTDSPAELKTNTVNISGNLQTDGNSPLTLGDGFSPVLAADNITIAGDIIKTDSTADNLTLKAKTSIILNGGSNGLSITSSNAALNITLDADSDSDGVGGIAIYNTNINSQGGNILLGGGTLADTIAYDSDGKTAGIGYARHYAAAHPLGGGDGLDGAISIKESTINAGGGNIALYGENTAVWAPSIGVDLITSGITTTGNGNIYINGIGSGANSSGSDSNSFGVNIVTGTPDASYITTQNGRISIVGGTEAATNKDAVGGVKFGDAGNQATNIYSLGGGAVKIMTDGSLVTGYSLVDIGYQSSTGTVYDSPVTISAGLVNLANASVKTHGTIAINSTGGGVGLGNIAAANTWQNDSLTINAAGTVSQAAGTAVTADSLAVTAGGPVTLDRVNDIGTLAVNANNNAITINNGANNLTIGTVNGVTGINSGLANTVLTDSGAVSQNAAITAAGLELLGGGTYHLATVDNSISTLAGAVNTLEFQNNRDFTVGTVNTAGLTADGAVTLATNTAGSITVDQSINKTGNGSASLLLQAFGDVIFRNGADVNSGSGQWNITLDSDWDHVGGGAIVLNNGSVIDSNGGDIVLGGGNSPATMAAIGWANNDQDDKGVFLAGAQLLSHGGNITVRGQSVNGTNTDTNGIMISNSLLDSGTGKILLVGTTVNTGGTNSIGIDIQGGSLITSASNGADAITITGSGTAAANTVVNNGGVMIQGGSTISATADGGGITITGIGGAGNDPANHGIEFVNNGGSVTATSGSIILNGTRGGSGSTAGIYTDGTGGSLLRSTTGSITLNADRIHFEPSGGNTNIIGSTSGSITLNADTVDLNSVTIASAGSLTVRPKTAGTSIGIGDSASGTLNLNTAEISTFQNGFSSITIGRADGSGAVDVESAIFKDPLTIESPATVGSLTVNGTLSTVNGTENNSLILNAPTIYLNGSLVTYGGAVAMTGNTVLGNGTATRSVDTTGSGTLAGGAAIMFNGAVTGTNNLSLEAGTNGDISLTNAGNDMGTIAADGHHVAIVDANAIDLGPSKVTGDLQVTVAAGDITNSGPLQVSGAASFAANGAGSSIYITNAGNDFEGSLAIAGNALSNVSITDTTALELPAMTVTHDLYVSANGITQNGALVVGDTTSMRAGSNTVTLDKADNDFGSFGATGGTVVVNDKNSISLNDITAGSLELTAHGPVSQTAADNKVVVTGGTTVTANGNSVNLGNDINDFHDIAVSGGTLTLRDANAVILDNISGGSLTLAAGGDVTQGSGTSITVTGATGINAGSNAITLSNDNNDFGSLGVTGKAITVNDKNGVALEDITADSLTLTAGGDVTQSNGTKVTAAGATSLKAVNHNITLNNDNNDFTGKVAASGVDVTLRDVNGIELADTDVTGRLDLTTGGGISQTDGTTISASNLAIIAGGNVNLKEANTIGTAAVSAAGHDITLRDDGGFTVGSVTRADGSTMKGLNAGGGSVHLITSGMVDETNPITTGGLALTGSGGIFNLDTQPNTIQTLAGNTGTINLNNTGAVTIGDVTANAVTTTGVTTGGTFTLATNNGNITQSNPLVVTGAATLDAGSGNITLTDGSNDFKDRVAAIGGNVTLQDANGIQLGTTQAANLDVIANGNVTQDGSLTVNGTTSVNAGAGAISLSDNGNLLTGAVTLANSGAHDIDLNNTTATILGGVTTGQNLTVHSNGPITQANGTAVSAANGTTTFTAGSGNDITLNNAGNDFSTVTVISGRDVSLKDSNDINLAQSTISGALDVTTLNNGNISQNGPLVVTGAATLDAGSGNIILTDGGNDFKGRVAAIGGNVTLQDANSIMLGTTQAANLDVIAHGDVTQDGTLTVNGTTSVNAGAGAINLNDNGNLFTGAVTLINSGAHNIDLNNTTATILGGVTAGQNLTVHSNGPIIQMTGTAINAAGGTTTFTAGSGDDITLNNAGNDFSTVAVASGWDVRLKDNNDINLAQSTVSGALDVTTLNNGNISQNGSLVVTGAATLNAGGGNITLTDGGNDFKDRVVTTGTDVTLRDANGIELGGTNVTGRLDLTTGGGISQSDGTTVSASNLAITAGGNVNLKEANTIGTAAVSADGHDITLRDDGGFTVGSVTRADGSLTSGLNAGSGNVQLITTGIVDETAPITTSGLALTGSDGIFNLDTQPNTIQTLAANTAGTINLNTTGAVTIGDVTANAVTTYGVTTNGSFNLAAGGAVTQSGALVAHGPVTLNTDSDITLNNNGNDFSLVTVTNGRNVILKDSNDISLGQSTISGALDVTTLSNGNITQSGPLTVTGAVTLNAGGGNIALIDGSNDFKGRVATTGANVTLQDANGIQLGTTQAVNLGVIAHGDVTQDGSLKVSGTTSVNAGAGTVNLSDNGNLLTGAVTLANTGAHDIGLNNTTATILRGVTAGQNLTIQSNGPITQMTGTAINAASGITALTAGSGNDITLNNSGNDFSTVTVISGRNVSLKDGNDINLGQSTISGALDVTTLNNGNISQNSPLAVTGPATLNAGGGNITLTDGGNDFKERVATTGTDVTLQDANGIELGGTNVTGRLDLTTGGGISQTDGTTISASNLAIIAGGNVNLKEANTIGTAAVSADGHDITLRADGGFAIGSVTRADGSLTSGLNAGSGNVHLITTGTVDETAPISTGGLALTGSGGTFSLGTQPNTIQTLAANTGTININNTGAVTIGDVTANAVTTSGVMTGGTFTLATNNGNITQSNPLVVTGAATLDAGSGNITLTDGSNDFKDRVAAIGGNVTLQDANGIQLGTTQAANLDVIANGNVTQDGSLTVNGTTSVNAGAISLSDNGNLLTGAVTLANSSGAHDIDLNNTTATILGGVTAGQNLTVHSSGPITQANGTAVNAANGTTTLTAGSGDDITLNNAGNDFSTVAVTSGRDVSLKDSNDINLAQSTVSGALDVTTLNNGNISQNGSLVVTGAATLNAGGGNITLTDGGNDFKDRVVTTGTDVTLRDANGIELGGTNVTGRLDLTTGGGISQSDGTTVSASNLAITAGGNVNLKEANTIGTAAVSADGHDITLRDDGGFTVGSVTRADGSLTSGLNAGSGNVHLITTGIVDETAPITTSGLALTGSDGTFNLDTQPNTIQTLAGNTGTINLNNTGAVIIGDVTANAVTTYGVTTNGSFNLAAGGAVTQSGALVAHGPVTLNTDSDITLNNNGNDFSLVTVTNGRNVTLKDSNDISLGQSTISGALDVTTLSNGNITQSGPLTVTGAATLNAGGGNIILTDGGNDFKGRVATTGANVTLQDANGIELGGTDVTGRLDLTAGGGISQTSGTMVTVANLAITADGNVNLKEANTIGTVAVSADGHDITIRDDGGFTVGSVARADGSTTRGLNAGRGSVQLITTGMVDENNPITANGLVLTGPGGTFNLDTQPNSIQTLAANTGTIDINSPGAVNIGSVTVNTVTTTGVTTSGSFSLTAGGPITQSGDLAVGGNATFTASGDNGRVTLGNETVGQNLTVIADQTIEQTPGTAIDVHTGTAGLAAGSADNPQDITLNNTGNDFGTVAVTRGKNVTLNDTGGLDLGASDIAGPLTVTAAGAVTNSGAMTVAGPAILDAGAGNDITLDQANDFSTVQIVAGKDVTLRDTNDIDLGTSQTSGSLTVTAGGTVTQRGDIRTDGNLSLTAGSGVSQTEGTNLIVAGPAVINAGTGAINLNNGGNVLSGPVALANSGAYDIILNNSTATTLAAVTAGQNLTVTSGGSIDQTENSALIVPGLTTLNAGGHDITLNNSGNDFSTVTVTGGRGVSLKDDNDISLGSSTITGPLAITTLNNGNITQTGPLAVTGPAALNAGAGDIILADDRNDFAARVATTGTNVVLHDANGIQLGTSQVGDLTVVAHGDVTQDGSLSVAGPTAVRTENGAIDLTDAGNDFAGPVSLSDNGANNAQVSDKNSIILGSVSLAGGNLTINAGGGVSQSGDGLVATAGLAVTANGPVDLGQANDIGTIAVISQNNPININNGANNLIVGSVNGVDGLNSGAANTRITITGDGALIQRATIAAGSLELLVASADKRDTAITESKKAANPVITDPQAGNMAVTGDGSPAAGKAGSPVIEIAGTNGSQSQPAATQAGPTAGETRTGTTGGQPTGTGNGQPAAATAQPTASAGAAGTTAAANPGASLAVTNGSGITVQYTVTETKGEMTITAPSLPSAAGASPVNQQTAEIPVFQLSGGQERPTGAYQVSSLSNGLTLVPVPQTAAAAAPTGGATEYKSTFTMVRLGNGETGTYNVGFNGHTIFVYPLDEAAKKLVQETQPEANKPIVATSLLAATRDMGLSLSQIQAVYLYGG